MAGDEEEDEAKAEAEAGTSIVFGAISTGISRLMEQREMQERVKEMVDKISYQQDIRCQVNQVVGNVAFKDEIRSLVTDIVDQLEEKQTIQTILAEMAKGEEDAGVDVTAHEKPTFLIAEASRLRQLQHDAAVVHSAVAKMFQEVVLAGEVHEMVSRIFERVVFENEDVDPERAIPSMVSRVLHSVVRAARLRELEAERLAKLALLPHPLVHFMVSRIIRKVVKAANCEVKPGWNLEEQNRLAQIQHKKEFLALQDIVRLSKEKFTSMGREISLFLDILAYFQLRAAMLQFPDRCKFEDDTFGDEIAQLCVGHLTEENCPAQETIRLQVYAQVPLHLELRPLVERYKRERLLLEDILEDVTQIQVTDMRKTYDMVEALHVRLLDYVQEANAQLDDAAGAPEMRPAEVQAAFESIYSQASCLFWMDLPKDEKLLQVPEMATVVIGIRAFNKYRGKGGDSFRCPFESYTAYCNAIGDTVSGCLRRMDQNIQKCAEAIFQHIQTVGVRNVVIQRLRDELAFYHESFALLEGLESFLSERFEIVAGYSDSCAEHMQDLQEMAGTRKCIANELVLPILQALGTLVSSAFDELKLLETYAKALKPFLELVSQPPFKRTPADIATLGTSSGLDKLDVLMMYTTMLDPELCNVDWHENDVILSDVETQKKSKALVMCAPNAAEALESGAVLQYGGYCPVALAKHRGLLLMGNANLGLVKIEGLFYAFSSSEALKQFSVYPSLYLEAVENVVRKMPQLVHILALENTAPFSVVNISGLIETLKEPIPCDFSGQTSLHLARNSSLVYTSEALRKRLFNKRTDSTQTDSSYYRRSSCAQVWPPKENWTQTRKHTGTNATVNRVRNVLFQASYQF